MEGFDGEIDTEFSSGLSGGSGFFEAFSQKRFNTHDLTVTVSLDTTQVCCRHTSGRML